MHFYTLLLSKRILGKGVAEQFLGNFEHLVMIEWGSATSSLHAHNTYQELLYEPIC